MSKLHVFARAVALAGCVVLFAPIACFAQAAGPGHGSAGASGPGGSGGDRQCDGRDCRPKEFAKTSKDPCGYGEVYYDDYGHVITRSRNPRCRIEPGYGQPQ